MGGPEIIYVEQPANWPAVIAAWTALVGVVIAVATFYVQGRRTRRQIGIDNMWRMIDRWDGQDGRQRRANAAGHLVTSPPTKSHEDVPTAVWEVLNEMELLGYLVKAKTVRLKDVWTNFPGVVPWWHVCLPIIESYREEDSTLYEDCAKLVKRMVRLERKRRGPEKAAETLAPEKLTAFLRSEVELGRLDQPEGRGGESGLG